MLTQQIFNSDVATRYMYVLWNMGSFCEGPLWKVVNIPGKGQGVVAKSSIPKGTLILQDSPLFIVPNSVHTDNPEDLNSYLERQVNNLTEDDRSYFYSLADCKVKVTI